MKNFLLLLFLPSAAMAQQGIQVVHEVATSTNTLTQTINLCNTDLTGVDVAARTSSGTLAGSFGVEVYNSVNSTSTLSCGFDVSLSTSINSAWYGREVSTGTGVLFQVLSSRKVYCMTLNAVGCTRATITQFK